MKLKIVYKLVSIILLTVVSFPILFHNYDASAFKVSDKNITNISEPQDYLVKVKDISTKEWVKDKYNADEIIENQQSQKNIKKNSLEIDKWVKVKINNQSEIDNIKKDNNVQSIEKDQKRKLFATPDDKCFLSTTNPCPVNSANNPDGQWNLKKICLGQFGISSPCNSGWETASATGSANTVVAVIDTGIDLNHLDLTSNIWVNPAPNADPDYPNAINGWNFADNNNNVQDVSGHGTHVSGVIAATGNNNRGITGICWSCKIMPLKVVNSQNYATDSDIVSAIHYAVDHGAKVINMSLGGPGYSQILQDAVDYAWSGGNINTPNIANSVLVVSSSGNDAESANNSYPGGLLNSLSIGATDSSDAVPNYSNKGKKLDIVAPGDNILSTYKSGGLGGTNDTYYYLSGTSMASPHVAGLAALLFDKHRLDGTPWNSRDVRYALLHYSYDTTPTSFTDSKGFGRINALNTLTSSKMSSDSTAPVATLTTPTQNPVPSTWNITGTASDSNLYIYHITIQRVSNGEITQVSGRSSVTNGVLYSLDTSSFANDYYNVSMVVEDYAGNTTSSSVLNNVAMNNPGPGSFTLSSPSNNAWVNTLKPNLTWTTPTSATTLSYNVIMDGTAIVSGISSTNYTPTSNLSSGSHTWSVIANNDAGSTNSNAQSFNIDNTSPNDFLVEASVNGSSVTLTFSTTDGSSGISHYDISLSSSLNYSYVSSPYTQNNLPDGSYLAYVYAYDGAGNSKVSTKSFTVDILTPYLKSKGDLTINHIVDLSDLSILAQNYGKTTSTGDINGDGKVDLSDLSILAQNWQKSF